MPLQYVGHTVNDERRARMLAIALSAPATLYLLDQLLCFFAINLDKIDPAGRLGDTTYSILVGFVLALTPLLLSAILVPMFVVPFYLVRFRRQKPRYAWFALGVNAAAFVVAAIIVGVSISRFHH